MTTMIETAQNGSQPSLLGLILGIIDRPRATFQAIMARPHWPVWLTPLFIFIVCLAVLLVVEAPYQVELARQQAEQQLATLPAGQSEAARAMMETTLSLPFMLGAGLAFGAAALVIGVLAQAVFLYFAALVLGGEANFGSIFRVSLWSRFPVAMGVLVRAGFTAVSQQMIHYPGLSFLVGTGNFFQDGQNPLYVLFSQLDLFWLWQVLLLVIGLMVAARLGQGKALVLALVYTALSLGLSVLPALIFGGMAAR